MSLPAAKEIDSVGRLEPDETVRSPHRALNAAGDGYRGEPVEASVTLPNHVAGSEAQASRSSVTFPGSAPAAKSASTELLPVNAEQAISSRGASRAAELESAALVDERSEMKRVASSPPYGTGTQGLKPLRGQITGLTSGGLVLTDAIGHVLRPKPNVTVFEFLDGVPYLRDGDGHQLIVVRQPLEQTCEIETSAGSSIAHTIRCTSAGGEPVTKLDATMRDCFQVTARSASFTLGYESKGQWLPFADVAMDPVGIDRQQHRTYMRGELVLEAIIHLPLVTPVANIEWLSFSGGGIPGSAIQRTGKVGGMPLDLKVGETRSFTVTAATQNASHSLEKLASAKQHVKLMEIGPLNTRAGRFQLACRLEELAPSMKDPVQSWYAPGYGIVKTKIRLPDGEFRTLEAMEIQQRPN